MKNLNKKSKVFAFGLAIILLIALSRVYFLVHARKQDLSGQFTIGTNQLNMFGAIQEAEKEMLYGEEGFGLAFQQSLYEIARAGGYSKTPICGKSGEYVIWRKDNNTECYPDVEQVKQSIAESTLDLMNSKYLADMEGYSNNHELFFEQKGDKLIARAYALAPAKQGISCDYAKSPESTGACGSYYYKPSFRKAVNFNIDDFREIVGGAKELSRNVESCIVLISSCVNSELAKINAKSELNWGLCEVLGVVSEEFPVCVGTGNKALVYNEKTEKMEIKDIDVRFVLAFP